MSFLGFPSWNVLALSVEMAYEFFLQSICGSLKFADKIARELIKEIRARLGFLKM